MDQVSPEIITLSILATVSFSVLAWDHCLLLPAEYQVVRRIRRSWKEVGPWMFICLRYTGLAALFANMFMSTARHQNCGSASAAFRAFHILSNTAFCVLITLRVTSMWKKHPDVVSALGFLSLVVIGLWVAVATQIKPLPHHEPLFGPSCGLHAFPSWFSSTYAAALAFNLAAFALAAVGVFKRSNTERDVRQGLRLLGFLIICITASIVILTISALGYAQQVNRQAAAGFFTLIIVSSGSRIYLTGDAEHYGPGTFSSHQYTDPSWQSPSTINQSAIGSVPNASFATKPTGLTNESHVLLPLGTSLGQVPHDLPPQNRRPNGIQPQSGYPDQRDILNNLESQVIQPPNHGHASSSATAAVALPTLAMPKSMGKALGTFRDLHSSGIQRQEVIDMMNSDDKLVTSQVDDSDVGRVAAKKKSKKFSVARSPACG